MATKKSKRTIQRSAPAADAIEPAPADEDTFTLAGSNRVSIGSRWFEASAAARHDAPDGTVLYRTPRGNFVLEGELHEFSLVSARLACEWLVSRGFHAEAAAFVPELYAEAEL